MPTSPVPVPEPAAQAGDKPSIRSMLTARMAEALGHNVPLVFMGVFGAGAALAGLAGAVAGAFYTTNPNMALELGVMVFVVVVVGGLGSLHGAIIGGPEKVARGLRELAKETGADELMISTLIPAANERIGSYERVARALG